MPALAFACILLALAPNVAVLVAARYLLRLFGQGMMPETALTEVGRWFVASRGRAIALIVQGLQLGAAILPPTVVLIHRATGDWRFGWFASAALLLLMLPWVIALSRVPRVPQAQEIRDMAARTARDWTRAEVLREPIFYLLLSSEARRGGKECGSKWKSRWSLYLSKKNKP